MTIICNNMCAAGNVDRSVVDSAMNRFFGARMRIDMIVKLWNIKSSCVP